MHYIWGANGVVALEEPSVVKTTISGRITSMIALILPDLTSGTPQSQKPTPTTATYTQTTLATTGMIT
jgi:hypothetical protein